MRAVELNGAAVEMNKTAFAWGRLAAIDPDAVFEAAGIVRNAPTASESTPRDLEATPPGEWESTEWGATSTPRPAREEDRSEEHTSELQSLMRISYAVFCLRQKKKRHTPTSEHTSAMTKKTRNHIMTTINNSISTLTIHVRSHIDV